MPETEAGEERASRETLEAVRAFRTGKVTAKAIGQIAAALAVVATLVGYGVGIGHMSEKVAHLEAESEKQSALIEKLRNDASNGKDRDSEKLEKAFDAVRQRFREVDAAINDSHESLIAVRTELRVRFGAENYTPSSPTEGKGRPLPRKVQAELAAEAADEAIESAEQQAPLKRPTRTGIFGAKSSDPLEGLSF